MPFQKPHQVADLSSVKTTPGGGWEILPKGFNIVWGNDRRYWTVVEDQSATLTQVCWLEVSGSVRVQKGKTYNITFQVSLKSDAFGWNNSPVLVMAKVGKRGEYKYQEVTMDVASLSQPTTIPTDSSPLSIEVSATAPDPTLHFGLYEVWSGKWKGGLQIYKATIKPVS